MSIQDLSANVTLDAPRTTSRLAIASLVLSIVFCCPVTTIAGIVMGAIAVALTTKDTRVAGRWLAVLAITIGLLGTAFQATVATWGYKTVFVPVLTGPESAIRSGDAGDIEVFVARFAVPASKGNTVDNAKVFLEELKSRYGALTSAGLDQGATPTQIAPSGRDFVGDYMLDFANGRVRATCSIELADAAGALSMRLTQMTIHDAALGNLHYPPVEEVEKAPGKSN